ncbi:hypothetical protein B0T26DRAFT_747043 [Lasiosphaeria miniovina]|uniref:Uncharacterized protein n=1 Tax=Lasiosphaeria miniovina TaxID=1954250 RepID=A0AA40EBA7_9PEZI|nr:uncharacterized protein B0T26DRAFT_747043 [Lasiosphaeria miniovina]KAK0735229.1 hypothetical protein B0T26DRAFT_747043 [Lasiosphaeria miniovina]
MDGQGFLVLDTVAAANVPLHPQTSQTGSGTDEHIAAQFTEASTGALPRRFGNQVGHIQETSICAQSYDKVKAWTVSDKSLGAATTQVLRCKRERWEANERKRKRDMSALEGETIAFFEHDRE